MRGKYFVKFLNGTGKANVDRVVESQAHRTGVAAKVVSAKVAGNAVKKLKLSDDEQEAKKVWDEVGNSIVERERDDEEEGTGADC